MRDERFFEQCEDLRLAAGLRERELGIETSRTRFVNNLERSLDLGSDALEALARAGLKAERQYVATQIKQGTTWAKAYAHRAGRECSE